MLGMTTKHIPASAFLILIALSLLSIRTTAHSQSFAQKGVVELGGSISYKSTKGVGWGYQSAIDQGSFTALPYAGYFVTDGFELGVNPLGVSMSGDQGAFGPGNATNVMILAAPSYNFKTGGIVYPFVEALFGYTSMFSSSDYPALTGFSWGGRIGVKFAVADHGLINLGAQYLLLTYNPRWAKTRYGFNELTIAAGFSLWL